MSLIESFKRHLLAPEYSLEDLLREIIEETGYVRLLEEEDSEDAKGRIENIEELISKVVAYEENCEEEPTLSGFLEEVALVADIDNVEESSDTLLLMTLHSAKGLEFPYVYLTGMEDGIFPSYASIMDNDEEAIEEERRLCYVGITRAMQKLSLSCARCRFRNGEQQFNRPSRFIDEIPRYLMKQCGGIAQTTTNPFSTSGAKDTNGGGNRWTSDTKKNTTNYSSSWNPTANKSTKKSGATDLGSLFAGNPYISKGFGKNTASSKSTSTVNYSVGDRVSHVRFGEGTVTEMKDTGGDYQVTVAFDGDINRKMMASFAKLKKL